MKTKTTLLILVLLALSLRGFSQIGIGTNTPNTSAALDITSTTSGLLPPRMTTEQRAVINSPAAGLTVYDTTTNSNWFFNGTIWVNAAAAAGSTTHTIGESYGGGIVFYVYDGGQHGLIAATADQSTAMQWFNGTPRYTGTTGDGLGAGAMNTAMIIATQMADNQTGNFAAKVCADYSVTVSGVTYGDWYLPSKYELNLLFAQKTRVGGFASAWYWSSTENDNNIAWRQIFGSGTQDDSNKSSTFVVRAVRAF